MWCQCTKLNYRKTLKIFNDKFIFLILLLETEINIFIELSYIFLCQDFTCKTPYINKIYFSTIYKLLKCLLSAN